ncbi:MAG: NAD(+) synthase [Flavobacteriia bacterium]|jgi:NAD+ synthase|nr:MAG: NAD(+) synthase [Flavobacteriia bacterium]
MHTLAAHISNWLGTYLQTAHAKGFVVGISGGIDSAVTSTLCALTGAPTICLTMPIRQTKAEFDRAGEHMQDLQSRFANVRLQTIDLTPSFETLSAALPANATSHALAMANTRARLRMTTLYAVAQANSCLVAGTGNKVEDFGVGFYTKYGDGGVDLSPIADLMKTEVFALAKALGVVSSIQNAAPTDGLWEDGRSDEDQIGATYPELEWAMCFNGETSMLDARQQEVLAIFNKYNRANAHKMQAIPVCEVPNHLKALLKQ